jgi:hypothetical protein
MTTPSGTISLQDVRVEAGGPTPVSFNDLYVRQVGKQLTGSISLGDMRSKTCLPAAGSGGIYASSYYVNGTTEWRRSGSFIYIREGGVDIATVFGDASTAYVDVGSTRYYKVSLMANVLGTEFWSFVKVIG